MTDAARTPAADDGWRIGQVSMAVIVPLAVLALAYGLWVLSDRLLYIGPLDRATFGWLVVVPVWLLAPVAAGFVSGRLRPGQRLVAAIVVSVVVAGFAAILFGIATMEPDCQFGPRQSAPSSWLWSVILGVVIGSGVGLSSLLAARFVRARHPWRAVIFGASAELAMAGLAIVVTTAILIGSAGCERPPL